MYVFMGTPHLGQSLSCACHLVLKLRKVLKIATLLCPLLPSHLCPCSHPSLLPRSPCSTS